MSKKQPLLRDPTYQRNILEQRQKICEKRDKVIDMPHSEGLKSRVGTY